MYGSECHGFYPADPKVCREWARSLLRDASRPDDKAWFGGTVAHAGWKYSGEVAGQTIGTIAARTRPDVVVIFSAIHTQMPQAWGVVDAYTAWQVPNGTCEVAADLRAALLRCGNVFAQNNSFHVREHAIEVVLPLVKEAFPDARIVPIEVPPHPVAEIIGRKTAEAVAAAGVRAIYLASTDLTHYGTHYRFMPMGVGPGAMEWAKKNDEPLLDRIRALDAAGALREAVSRHSACGAGAVAAMLAACRHAGATAARVLEHTTSYEVLKAKGENPRPDNAVGYAAAVVG